jgi:hypothetical protein
MEEKRTKEHVTQKGQIHICKGKTNTEGFRGVISGSQYDVWQIDPCGTVSVPHCSAKTSAKNFPGHSNVIFLLACLFASVPVFILSENKCFLSLLPASNDLTHGGNIW